MNSKKTLCIITCSEQKIWDKHKDQKNIPKKAKEAYTGKITKLGIKFAEKFFNGNYAILSAKYGLLNPDELICNYNLHIKNLCKKEREELINKIKNQIKEKNLNTYDEIIVIAGSDYLKIVKEVFKDKKIYVIRDWQNKKYGEKVKLLNEILKKESISIDLFEEV